VPLLHILAVAAHALLVDFLFRKIRESDDLADVAAPFHVLRSGTVTRFTPVAALERRLEVRCSFEVLFVEVLVACLADVSPYVLCRRLYLRHGIVLLLSSHEGQPNCEKQQRY